jgi:hypothetical protein
MSNGIVGLFILVLVWPISVSGQSKIDENVPHVPDEVIAANKRLHDLLQKPNFITLRLTYGYAYEKPVDRPQPYKVGDSMYFELLVSQSLFENIMIEESRWAHYEYRPELSRDGEILSYSKEAQKAVDKADHEPPSWSMIPLNLVPGREFRWPAVRLEDWYDRLGPGHYELTVRKRFALDGDWVQSNSVTFDVQPRKSPTPIPAGVTIELAPADFQLEPKRKLYRLSGDVYVSVIVVNGSRQEVPAPVVDSYYGDRPQLFKDGVMLPYQDEIKRLLKAKENDSRAVDVSVERVLAADSREALTALNLTKWYGRLSAGHYRLVNQHRFELDGPWTGDSAELLFEILP